MKSLIFTIGDKMSALGEQTGLRFLTYNPITWRRFLISARRSGKVFAETLRELLPDVRSVCDVGAGTGGYVMRLRQAGFRAEGVEYASFGRMLARLQGVDLGEFDCSRPDSLPELGRFDAVFSIEVGEHLPAELSDTFVDYIAARSDLVLFSAAFPGQGGQGHINEQPKEYWSERFIQRGCFLDDALTRSISQRLAAKGFRGWLPRNLQVFRATSRISPNNPR